MHKLHGSYFIFLIFILSLNIIIYLLPVACNYNDDFCALYSAFAPVCHQIDSRTFYMFGSKLPVCGRCQGIYLAGLISTFLYPFIKRISKSEFPPVWLLLLSFSIIGIDVVLEWSGAYGYISMIKFLTGFFLGFVLPFFLLPGLQKFFEEIQINKLQHEHK